MALSRRRGTLEPLSSNGFNMRNSIGLPSRGVSRASLGPNFDKGGVNKPQVHILYEEMAAGVLHGIKDVFLSTMCVFF